MTHKKHETKRVRCIDCGLYRHVAIGARAPERCRPCSLKRSKFNRRAFEFKREPGQRERESGL